MKVFLSWYNGRIRLRDSASGDYLTATLDEHAVFDAFEPSERQEWRLKYKDSSHVWIIRGNDKSLIADPQNGDLILSDEYYDRTSAWNMEYID